MANTFDADNEAVTSEEFTFSGRTFKVGTVFPHKDYNLPPIELKGLHLAGKISFVNRPAVKSKGSNSKQPNA